MFKRQFKCAIFSTTIVAAMIPLSGCSSDGTEKFNAIQDYFSPDTSMSDEGVAAVKDSDGSLSYAVGRGVLDMTPVIFAELRHFDIYRRYRILFDASSNSISGGVKAIETEAHPAASSGMDKDAKEVLSACSMRALLMQD